MVVQEPADWYKDPCVDGPLLEYVWADDEPRADPFGDSRGAALFAEAGELLRRERPGERVVIHASRDANRQRLRFSWSWLAADGTCMLRGVQFGERGDHGWLSRILGFFHPWPDVR